MPSVPQSLINLYQWITYLAPIWGLALAILWKPLKNLYYKLIKKPDSDNSERLSLIEQRLERMDVEIDQRKQVSRALLHNLIFQNARAALIHGYITEHELENLEELYLPYKRIGGNGTAEKLFNDCKNLEIINPEGRKNGHKK